ncbi:BTAD domain-containing putative transcriptional regulator [Streptomyces sp. NPDC048717]|uniref:AfsR/SARP family transcriptional regulator n=1 Tax=Streptomyces sp. NPDC048717 TaxID=3154928 RepID=UPI003417C453
MAVRFGVLGDLTLHVDGERRPVPGKAGLLLAVLLLPAGRPRSVDELVDGLWGSNPPRTAYPSLHNHIARLRTALGPERDRLTVAGGSYACEVHPGELDAAEFETRLRRAQRAGQDQDWPTVDEEARAALALWRGRPLPAFPSLHESPELVHLREQHLQVAELRFEAALRAGDHHEITAELAGLTADHPLHEPIHRQLMTALHRGGRPADALAVYHRLRRRLVEELGVDPAPGTRRIFEEVLTAKEAGPGGREPSSTAAPAADSGAAAPAAPAPASETRSGKAGSVPAPAHPALNQIPRDTPDFTDRTAELATITARLLEPPGDGLSCLVVISGMGGVGKTALAVRAAHGTRDAFPDGQLYADLRGFGVGSPRSAHELLARFLVDLGVPAHAVPDDTDDRAALYRARLAERRVLIILDNARDSEQVAPLIPGGGPAAVIVTSRHLLAGLPTATRVALQPFGAPDQYELLAALCGTERLTAAPPATERILAACAGLPLALRIVGSRLAHNAGRSVEHFAARFSSPGGRLAALTLEHLDVTGVFEASYQALATSPRRLDRAAAAGFRLLGLWPRHPFSVEAASALLDQPLGHTIDVLDTLVDACLLQNPAEGTYRFHDLLGEFAAQLASEETRESREQALVRLGTWYCAALERADTAVVTRPRRLAAPRTEAVLPDFADRAAGLDWITRELPALTTLVGIAGAGPRPELAWLTAGNLLGWVTAHRGQDLWERPLVDALDVARRENDLAGQAMMHNLLGVAHGCSYRNEISLRHLYAADDLLDRLGRRDWQTDVLGNIGNAAAQAGRYEEGLAAIRKALPYFAGAENLPVVFAHTHATLLFRTGDLEGAEATFRACLERCRVTHPSYVTIVLVNLGDVLRARGRRNEALQCLEEACRAAEDIHHDFALADALEALARCHLHFGDAERAESCWRRSLEIAEKFGFERVISDCLAGLDSLDTLDTLGGEGAGGRSGEPPTGP